MSNSERTDAEITRLVFSEEEVGRILGLHRTTVRAQALQPGTALASCVVFATPSKRVYPREAILRLVGISASERTGVQTWA